MKKEVIIVFLLFLAILSINKTNAIGISPSSLEYNFVPNNKQECDFLIINNVKNEELNNLEVMIIVEGDLSEHINLEKTNAILPPNQWTPIKCELEIPNYLRPGPNEISIIVREISSSVGIVGTIAGVKMPITIRVPYPGKYLEGTIEIPTVELGETVEFRVNVVSRGDQKIDNVYTLIEIYDNNKNKITEIVSDSKSINPGGRLDLFSYWNTEKASAGIYEARAKIYYDGNILELSDTFKVGDFIVDILDISYKPIKVGETAKFDVGLKSYWNVDIENVYSDLEIYKDGNKIGQSKSSFIKLTKWGIGNLTLFWDTVGQEKGNYEGKFIIHYGDKTIEQTKEFKIKGKSFLEGNTTLAFLILVVVLLVVLTIFNIFILRKKNEKK
ncbi:hypothetical protein K8R47_02975 [archaeon]|nr:hypothetical protein [archaeon]